MTKRELIEAVAKKTKLLKKDVTAVIEEMQQTVMGELKKGKKVALTGFGTFSVSNRAARTGVNPQKPTQKIKIPAMKIPKFTAGKTFKDSLKK